MVTASGYSRYFKMVISGHLVLAVSEEVAGCGVPEDGECGEVTVLSVRTLPLALLSDRTEIQVTTL